MITSRSILIIILLIMSWFFLQNYENSQIQDINGKKTWYKCSKDNYSNKMFIDALNNRGYNKTLKSNESNIYLYCDKDVNIHTLELLSHNAKKHQNVFFVYNCKYLGKKQLLWQSLKDCYGTIKAMTIMPLCYIFPDDINSFHKRYQYGKYYILKNEKQRQNGIKVTNNYHEIVNHKKKYNLIQEFIPNSLLYEGYKLNFRFYLVLYKPPRKRVEPYVYNDGIVTYASQKQDLKNITFNNTVSSFYTSQNLYDNHYPITFSQLENKMIHLPWYKMMGQALYQIQLIVKAVEDKINIYHGDLTTFQLFGVDVMFDIKLHPWILEVNMGPGMEPHNNNDKNIRTNLMHNIIDLIEHKGPKNLIKL